ncbi:MAG TPA: signal peptidase I [Lachnospiraceae bacterium]|nr:signal peptidase I [Lachnospiraceae bacterium]
MAVRRRKKNSGLKKLTELSVFMLVVLVSAYLILTFVTQRTMVKGSSMESTLKNGDNIMMDKLSYRIRDIRRGEVICFYSENERETLIKRVIGLPGERVRISGGCIYINDEELTDRIGGLSFAGRAENEVTLSSDEYFVLGDNRGDSIDSRFEEIGNVKRKNILGRAFLLFYPLNRIRIVK